MPEDRLPASFSLQDFTWEMLFKYEWPPIRQVSRKLGSFSVRLSEFGITDKNGTRCGNRRYDALSRGEFASGLEVIRPHQRAPVGTVMCAQVPPARHNPLADLTPRELRALTLLAEAKPGSRIASQCCGGALIAYGFPGL